MHLVADLIGMHHAGPMGGAVRAGSVAGARLNFACGAFQMAAAGRADVENYDWRASTRQVSEDGYNTALRLWQQSRKATSDWWPWWTKEAEWQA